MCLPCSRLTQIFAVSQSYLYHAYAWLKLFNFSRSYNKNLTASDQQMMATSVVLATLSILPYERALFGRTDDLSHEQEKERTIRMANILGFTVVRAAAAAAAAALAAAVAAAEVLVAAMAAAAACDALAASCRWLLAVVGPSESIS